MEFLLGPEEALAISLGLQMLERRPGLPVLASPAIPCFLRWPQTVGLWFEAGLLLERLEPWCLELFPLLA